MHVPRKLKEMIHLSVPEALVEVDRNEFYFSGVAFVPTKVTEDYVKEMEALFGAGSCYVLRIRPVGGFSFQA